VRASNLICSVLALLVPLFALIAEAHASEPAINAACQPARLCTAQLAMQGCLPTSTLLSLHPVAPLFLTCCCVCQCES
jgi:hypothetical protein